MSTAVVAAAVARYPGIQSGSQARLALGVFVVLLVAYALTFAHLCGAAGDSGLTLACIVAGAAIAASWLALGLGSSLGGSATLAATLLGVGLLLALSVGWLTTRRTGSRAAAIRCVGITAVTAGFTVFVLWAGETAATAGRPYGAGLVRDFKASGRSDLATYAVNDSLGTAMMLLLLVPLLTLAGGLVGAAAAHRARPRPPA
jgi:hypothetical protein